MKKRTLISGLTACLILFLPAISEAKLPLKVRDSDSQVKEAEQMLNDLGYEIKWIDEEFGYETLRAVKDFQSSEKIKVTGIIDKKTWDALKKVQKSGKKQDDFGNLEELKVNDKSPRVRSLEGQLVNLGYNIKWVDEEYGFETQRAVEAFQKDRKLPVTGRVDKGTWEALWGRGGPVVGGSAYNIRTQGVLNEAKRYMGVPYVWGGTTPKGFDCSGFIQYVWQRNGISIPRTADVQYLSGKKVSRWSLQPGDIVFFTTYEKGASHNGIYMGNNQFIHASSSRGVMVSDLNEDYWKTRYYGACRAL
ncbi:MAG: C40 family peptidase [Negativicutes bacterium]|nr:C40 family peptidase [Negativicutes bacterium]